MVRDFPYLHDGQAQTVGTIYSHDCGAHGCRLIRTILERLVAGDGIATVESDYALCRGTLAPVAQIRRQARDAGVRRFVRR